MTSTKQGDDLKVAGSSSLREERRELEAVSATLGSSSRLFRMITYIGEKYFEGHTENLHEYDIATEVFGRSKETFNAGEDAIVRVEAHRLRKKLKEYYESDGKDHPVHLSIPSGTYVPVFTRQSSEPVKMDCETVLAQSRKGRRTHLVAIVAVGLITLSAYLLFRGGSTTRDNVYRKASNSLQTIPSNVGIYADVPFRILAGYSGKPQIDSAGRFWQADQYFHYGGMSEQPDRIALQTSDPMLFKHRRNGDFFYDIPLRPGLYELHLYFIPADPLSIELSTFAVDVNGDKILPEFDVRSDAMGANNADERVFRDVSPAGNGILHLGFTSELAPATLNAIEILPGTPHMQLPIRIVAQPRTLTDRSGQVWHPDDFSLDGYTSKKSIQITGTPDPELFAAERYGHFAYSIPVDTRDRYTLILHFAESYFGPSASGTGGQGSRVFRVLCNGNTLLDNFDIFKEAGSLHALTKTFYHLKPTAQGKLNITFEPITNNATVSGIEVLDESK